MRKALMVLALSGILVSCIANQTKSTSEVNQSKTSKMTNKEIVGTFLGATMEQDTATMQQVAHADYIQHNPFVPTGLEPFIGLLPVLKEHGTHAENVRMFQDGDYVFMHNIWHNAKPFGANEMVAFDIIRVDENGKVAEHWDVLMPQTPPNASGRTLTDGYTEITDLDKTEENKSKAKALFNTLISGSQEEVGKIVRETFTPNYKQHNPDAGDGIEAVFKAFGEQEWRMIKQHKVLGEGNFVLSITEGTVKNKPAVFYDLLRFDKGKIVEHWDVIQEIPSEGLANNNTMFNFN
ncbi:MAG: nuclear transport factor 2 family protein [Crocinitomicaceae bacterium]